MAFCLNLLWELYQLFGSYFLPELGYYLYDLCCLQLCAGLKHMHSFDPPYSHNGVKPDNVLITQRKDQPHLAILMDFESARPARIAIRSQADAMQLQVPFCLFKYAKQTLSSIYITAC